MNAPLPENTRAHGLFQKFNVARVDGRDQLGGDRAGADYFVLDTTFDEHAVPAMAAYATSCEADYPALAADLRAKLVGRITADNRYVTVPESTVCGVLVPSFNVGQYLSAKGPAGIIQINETSAPWTNISYHASRAAAATAGLQLLTELQALAIAQNIVNQAINWTGGAIGEGKVFQGLHKGTVSSAQPGTFVSVDPDERRWHELSNGERIYDFAGNAYSWIFDDVQGDEKGIVARAITADSPSIAASPAPSKEKGMGWQPKPDANWSSRALARGGCWRSESYAGVFYLDRVWPDFERGFVGFRCTKP